MYLLLYITTHEIKFIQFVKTNIRLLKIFSQKGYRVEQLLLKTLIELVEGRMYSFYDQATRVCSMLQEFEAIYTERQG